MADHDTGIGTDWQATVGTVYTAPGGAVKASTGAGVVDTGTPRATLANNDPAVTSLGLLDNAAATPGGAIPAGAVQVSGSDGVNAQVIATDTGGTVWINQSRIGGTLTSVNAGNVDAGTQRMTLGATDPAVVSLGMIDDTVVVNGAAAGKALRVAVTDYLDGTAEPVMATGGAVHVTLENIAGNTMAANAGNVSNGTLQVVEAAISSSTPLALKAVDASEVEVLPAMAGRRSWNIQVYNDDSGPVCCALGVSTDACANAAFMLDASPAAAKAGGSFSDSGYSGAVTCRAMGAYTVNVARSQY
jgi:hypothetical protein